MFCFHLWLLWWKIWVTVAPDWVITLVRYEYLLMYVDLQHKTG